MKPVRSQVDWGLWFWVDGLVDRATAVKVWCLVEEGVRRGLQQVIAQEIRSTVESQIEDPVVVRKLI